MKHINKEELTVIGRAERIDLPKLGVFKVPAKTDTGADSSSIWVSDIKAKPEGLEFSLFGQGSQFYTGERLLLGPDDYEETRVANSFGGKELRYKIRLTVRVKGRLVRGSFTLADRSAKVYPVLLGRKLLAGKFVVDVKSGQPLMREERERKRRLQADLKKTGEQN
jgi:hypothetical protein